MIPEWADKAMSERLPQLRAQGEGQTLEFKRELEESTDQLKKEIAAFASTNAGLILVGVADDGTLIGLPGIISPEDRDLLRSKVEGRARAIKPAVTPTISFAVENGKTVLVIEIANSSQPIYYSNHIPYVRHVTQVHPAEPHEVIERVEAWLASHPSEAISGNGDNPLDADIQRTLGYITDAGGDPFRGMLPAIISKPCLILCLAPLAADPAKPLRAAEVRKAQNRFPPSTTERVKEDCDGYQWWSQSLPRPVSHGPNLESTWLMRLIRPGVLEYYLTFVERVDDDSEILVDGYHLEGEIVFGLERMASILTELGLGGPAVASVRLQGMVDIVLSRARPGGRKIGRHDIGLTPIFIPDLSEPIAGLVHDGFDVLWQTAGWPDGSPSFGSGDWAGYANARLYRD